ncbi:MAG: alkaline phosphatase family protein [Bryobacteraceae bacterium]
MLLRIIALLGAILAFLASPCAAAPKPKLILAIAVDQFRYDYLTRFRSEYTGGFHRLLTTGAVFSNAQYEHFPTVTAIGHSTFLSGAYPSVSGIVGNDWWEIGSGKSVTSVYDASVKLLGGQGEAGVSPRRMLVSTVGDELKMVNGSRSRVVGISWKDRSAVLPVGHMADGAYWVEAKTGAFVSSTYYFADLPAWVKDFNASKPAEKYLGAAWDLKQYGGAVVRMPTTPDEKFLTAIYASPFGNELIEAFAERAISAEQLGRREGADILAVSFSSNDQVGHDKGPDAPEVHAISVHTDKLLDKLFRFVDAQVGMQNILVVLTADHGVAPLPEAQQARRMPGGRMPARIVQDTVQKRLQGKYGEGKWIVNPTEHTLYFNRELIAQKGLDAREVQRVAAEAAVTIPHVARAYTREQLTTGRSMADAAGRRIMNGYHPVRGADLVILLEPYWIFGSRGTTHGTPYVYDSHVPVIFMGRGIKPGTYRRQIAPNDIAPTLCAVLEVDPPSGSAGRVLEEILAAE